MLPPVFIKIMTKENKFMKTTLTIITRTIMFPFFFGLAFFGAIFLFVTWIFNYIRFGGEAIADVFNRLNEKL